MLIILVRLDGSLAGCGATETLRIATWNLINLHYEIGIPLRESMSNEGLILESNGKRDSPRIFLPWWKLQIKIWVMTSLETQNVSMCLLIKEKTAVVAFKNLTRLSEKSISKCYSEPQHCVI